MWHVIWISVISASITNLVIMRWRKHVARKYEYPMCEELNPPSSVHFMRTTLARIAGCNRD